MKTRILTGFFDPKTEKDLSYGEIDKLTRKLEGSLQPFFSCEVKFKKEGRGVVELHCTPNSPVDYLAEKFLDKQIRERIGDGVDWEEWDVPEEEKPDKGDDYVKKQLGSYKNPWRDGK